MNCLWMMSITLIAVTSADSLDLAKPRHKPDLSRLLYNNRPALRRATEMSQYMGKTRLAYSRAWHHIDLQTTPHPLGRLASQIALILMGKTKPIYDPSTDCGDYVVCTNCAALYVTGKKAQQKLYYRHTTRPGSLKSISLEKLREKFGGGEVLMRAVRGMLPKNRLRDERLARLKCFEGAGHPYKENILRIGPGTSLARPFDEVQAMAQTTSMPSVSGAPAASQ